ncbi:MAG: hypothetical protein HYW78_04795 [Parcubacteria group bacterium]|nr:hypothetical protein [Parcubacteria group bacterium]
MFFDLIFKSIFSFVVDILYFPLWWYSAGLMRLLKNIGGRIQELWRTMSLRIFLRYLFVPMFGDYSRSGRVISFFTRLAMILANFVILLINIIFLIGLVALWLAVIPWSVWQVIN